MSDNKIIFAGPHGAGVSTAIKAISDIAPTMKEEQVKDTEGKEVTIEMDYGVLKLDTSEKIYLYGAPDREKLRLAHATLGKDCIGLILLINNAESEPIEKMFMYMEDCQSLVEKNGIAIGLTRYDDSSSPDINDYHVALREKKISVPVFSINSHEKNDIIMIIRALLYSLDSGVD